MRAKCEQCTQVMYNLKNEKELDYSPSFQSLVIENYFIGKQYKYSRDYLEKYLKINLAFFIQSPPSFKTALSYFQCNCVFRRNEKLSY